MTRYIDTVTQEYPLTERRIKAMYPNTSFPTPFRAPERFAVVSEVPQPAYEPITQSVREGDPQNQDGTWMQTWVVESLSPEQIAANLATAKEAKNNEINEARLAANFTAFEHAGKMFACDQLSRSDIDGTNGYVALNNALPTGWPGGWKAVDNTYHPITTVDDWKAFYASMFAQGNANFSKAQQLKARLEAATTAAEIAAIQWSDE